MLRNKFVVGVGGGVMYLVTAYYPNTDEWSPEFEKRRSIKMNCFYCKGQTKDSTTTHTVN